MVPFQKLAISDNILDQRSIFTQSLLEICAPYLTALKKTEDDLKEPVYCTINNQDVGRVDALLRDAAEGWKAAMDAIKFALVDADSRFGMSNDENFQQVQQAAMNAPC